MSNNWRHSLGLSQRWVMLCQITGRPDRLEISSNNCTLSRIGTDTPSEPREIWIAP